MRGAAFFIAACFIVAVVGCGTLGNNRDDLQQAAALHHIDLRWGRLENAAMRVDPELRGEFLTSWARRVGAIELQDIEVTGMVLNDAGDLADVVVTLTYIERDSMSVHTAVIPEKWIRKDGTWLCSKPAEPPAAPVP
jgi:hypothetical protein